MFVPKYQFQFILLLLNDLLQIFQFFNFISQGKVGYFALERTLCVCTENLEKVGKEEGPEGSSDLGLACVVPAAPAAIVNHRPRCKSEDGSTPERMACNSLHPSKHGGVAACRQGEIIL